MPTKYSWLPHWYEVNKNIQLYQFMYYITSENTGVLPGSKADYMITNDQLVIVIPFSASAQAVQTTGDLRSNYVIRMDNYENKGEGNATLQFGHVSPDDNSFKVFSPEKNVFEASANYTDDDTY